MTAGRRVSLSAGLALVCVGLTGCGSETIVSGYDQAMRYPLRKDPIVLSLPPADPIALTPSGKFEITIEQLDHNGGKSINSRDLSQQRQQELRVVLENLFGTPANPRAGPIEWNVDLKGLDLSPDNLASGSRVYRQLCNQCHGLTGDGRGPAGSWVYPHPRDFRTGVYKIAFEGNKPTAEELAKVIRHGIPGSSMQPFDLIPENDLRSAAAYTVHLSLRGEVEMRLIRTMLNVESGEELGDLDTAGREELKRVFDAWRSVKTPPSLSGSPSVDPGDPEYQESIRRGLQLFIGESGCANCHQDFGRTEMFKYSIWGTPERVTDLTRGEFRWGKDPNVLATRIRFGIPASGMPANPFLSSEQVNDLVNFVREIGYPQRLPADVRVRVYSPQ